MTVLSLVDTGVDPLVTPRTDPLAVPGTDPLVVPLATVSRSSFAIPLTAFAAPLAVDVVAAAPLAAAVGTDPLAVSDTSGNSPFSRANCTCSCVTPPLAAKVGSVKLFCLNLKHPFECWYAKPAHPEHPAKSSG
eukprot:508736-Amphidinium_carterae.1